MSNNRIVDEISQETPAQFMVYINKDLYILSEILKQTLVKKKAPFGLAERILKATVLKDAA